MIFFPNCHYFYPSIHCFHIYVSVSIETAEAGGLFQSLISVNFRGKGGKENEKMAVIDCI